MATVYPRSRDASVPYGPVEGPKIVSVLVHCAPLVLLFLQLELLWVFSVFCRNLNAPASIFPCSTFLPLP